MPWRDRLKDLKAEFDNMVKPGDPAPPPPGPRPMAPPPPGPRPDMSQPYYAPRFQHDIPTSVEWDAKLGNAHGWGNQELQHYTADPANSFHTPDGKLILRAIAKGSENSYTSARLVSRETLSRDHGLLTATILSPCAEGIWPAFWLLPQEPFSWPTDGEIDIAETWNGDRENHSCLHWGQHHEPHKHRVLGTHIPDMHARPVRYELAWSQPQGQAGRLVWYIDGRAIMKAHVPEGSRPMREMTVLLNIAMGGNVCGGKLPRDGAYDMVVFGLSFGELPARFEGDWQSAPEGRPY